MNSKFSGDRHWMDR